jgi:hypothetical protein
MYHGKDRLLSLPSINSSCELPLTLVDYIQELCRRYFRKIFSLSAAAFARGATYPLTAPPARCGLGRLRFAVALLTNALKAPVLRFSMEFIECSGYGIIANGRVPLSPSVHYLCQCLYSP